MPWVCLQFVIVAFPDHTHLLILIYGTTNEEVAVEVRGLRRVAEISEPPQNKSPLILFL